MFLPDETHHVSGSGTETNSASISGLLSGWVGGVCREGGGEGGGGHEGGRRGEGGREGEGGRGKTFTLIAML